MLRTKILILSLLFISILTNAQTCLNPSYKLNKLKAKGVNKDTIYNWAKNDLLFIELKPHDSVADIGSYNGYYPSLYSVSTDSIVFYLNDIVDEGFAYFDSINNLCKNIRGTSFTNKFEIILGNDDSTKLPANTFNKVILRDALHHFKHPIKMLEEIKRIIKPNGKIFLFESIINPNIEDQNLCKGSLTNDELIKLMLENGFTLTKQEHVGNSRFWFEFKLIN